MKQSSGYDGASRGELCQLYGIPVTPTKVLVTGEVQNNIRSDKREVDPMFGLGDTSKTLAVGAALPSRSRLPSQAGAVSAYQKRRKAEARCPSRGQQR